MNGFDYLMDFILFVTGHLGGGGGGGAFEILMRK